MSKIFNRYSQKGLRSKLRNNLTPHEKILWSKLKNSQVNNYKFRRQHGIGKFIVDFFCRELLLVIEVDGANHFFDEISEKYDKEREEFIKLQGIQILRFTNTEIKENIDGVMDVVYEKCRR